MNITCGPVTSRKRRGATSFDGRLRRSAKYAYVVDFKISIPFDLQSMKAADAYSFYDDMLYDVTDQLDKEVQAGAFNIGLGDLHVDSDSFAPGYTELDCAPGTMQRVSKGSCGKTCFSQSFIDLDKIVGLNILVYTYVLGEVSVYAILKPFFGYIWRSLFTHR